MTIVSKASAFPASVQPGVPKLGELPENWEKAPLGKYLSEVRRPIKMDGENKYRLVTVKRRREGIVERSILSGNEISVKSQFKIEAGDFLISKRQIVHGACGIVPKQLGGSIVSNEYAVLNGSENIDLQFLNYLSHSVFFQQTCFHSSIGVHVEKMIFKVDQWLKWPFLLPPLPEQKKIAEILSTWDRAIEVSEKLLENATNQKRALMQQLLTSKRRFPEFEGQKWREVKLHEIAEIIVSNVDKKSADDEIAVRLCNYTDVYKNDEITNNMPFMEATATAAQVKRFGLRIGDVIVTKDSETPSDIAVPAYVSETSDDLVCGYHLAIIRPKNTESKGRFLKHLFELPHSQYYFGTRANGATRFGLTISSIADAEFKVPSLDEQIRISGVIALSEAEISRYKLETEYLQSQKLALMQQLLTGKKRVKI